MGTVSIVDAIARSDIEDFDFACVLPKDHPEIADTKPTISRAHRDNHVGERVRVFCVLFDLADYAARHVSMPAQRPCGCSRIPDRFHEQIIAKIDRSVKTIIGNADISLAFR